MMLDKNIFLLWLQGWENAKWLQQQIAESWEINNPTWKIHYIDFNNLKEYVSDIDYIQNVDKQISPQTKSDIIRLSLLKNYGGVQADATLLCMQPLDNQIHDVIDPEGFWMYHGKGAEMNPSIGPASWFIISKKDNYMISKWKEACDKFWNKNNFTTNYFWMDELFKILFFEDETFQQMWLNTYQLYCDFDGQSHTLFHYGMENNTPHIKQLFMEKPPYVLKLQKTWYDIFPNIDTEECRNSNGYFAIQMSKRGSLKN